MGAGNAKAKQQLQQQAVTSALQQQQQNQPFERVPESNFFQSDSRRHTANTQQMKPVNPNLKSDQDRDIIVVHHIESKNNPVGQRPEIKQIKPRKPRKEPKEGGEDEMEEYEENEDPTQQQMYAGILEDPVLLQYLKVNKFFKDEADEDSDDDQPLNFKYANEKVSPKRWDQQTIVHEIFRVVQDITLYKLNLTAKGDMGRLNDIGYQNQLHQGLLPIEIAQNQIVNRSPTMGIQFYSKKGVTVQDIHSIEGFNFENLYDQNQNRILQDPPLIRNIGDGKLILSFRVEFRKLLKTAICKVPVNQYLDSNLFLQQMQIWSTLPYHRRMIRPLCFAQLNEKIPLVFIEDMALVQNLEQIVCDRSFYKGYQYRYELAHKIITAAIQIVEVLDHAHANGVLHMNLHPGNIMVPRCALKDEQYGFYVTDFGDPLFLLEDTVWTDDHEKVYQRMLKFQQVKFVYNYSPPHILSLIKHAAAAKKLEDRREYLRKIKQSTNTLIDIYCFGVTLLFMLNGGYDWVTTIELQSTFEIKMQKASLIIDLGTLEIMKAILKKCLLITRNDQPFDRISDMLPNLKTAQANVERTMRENGIYYYDYDNYIKPSQQFAEGKRKEEMVIKDFQNLVSQDYSKQENEIFQGKFRHQGGVLVGKSESKKKSEFIISDDQIIFNDKDKPKSMLYEDENVDLMTLNNQAVLAYLKQNYQQCLDMLYKFYDMIETNPISYFNYLILCWEGGIFSDSYVLDQIHKMAQVNNAHNFSSFMYALVYDAQNNWMAAKVNYELAMMNASDSLIIEMKRRVEKCNYFQEKYSDQFLFGHLEMSDVQDIVVSFDAKMAVTFQKTSRIIVWNLTQQKVLKEIEDKNATCMDANAKLDRIVVGLRNGLIVMFNLAYEDSNFVANVEEVELGFHTSMILVIKISKDGFYGISGGLDNYVALWNCQKKLLLSKIDIPGSTLKAAYMACDGMLGVSGGLDRQIFLWDLTNGECLREIQVTSFVVKISMSAMGKFLGINLFDGSVLIYECLTSIIWKTERFCGKHTGIAITTNNFMFEVAREGIEHKLINMLDKKKQKFTDEYIEARVGFQTSKSDKPDSKSQSQRPQSKSNNLKVTDRKTKNDEGQEMPIVPEVDPDQESDYRKTRQTNLSNQEYKIPEDDENLHNLNMDEEVMLQDLFFENAVFKYYYFQNEEFIKQLNSTDVYQELAGLNFERARDTTSKNNYLLKNSLEQFKIFQGITQQERAFQNFLILDDRRMKFDLNLYRQPKSEEMLMKLYDNCRLVLIAAETRLGEDSDVSNQGSVVGLRIQHMNVPFIGIGPCQFITNVDVTKNIQVAMKLKAKEMRQEAIQAFDQGSNEQAKYYLQRLREIQPLYMNPSVVKMWAQLQTQSYKKGKIQNIFKIKQLDIDRLHNNQIEHLKFTNNEETLILMSTDFRVSIWAVGIWDLKMNFRAYHDAHTQYYLKTLNQEQIIEEFDVSVIVVNDPLSMLVCGLHNGTIQFWELTQTKQNLQLEIPSHLADVTALVFNYDQSILVSAGADYLINVWSSSTKQLLFEIREHLGPITYLQIIEDQNESDEMEELIVSIDSEGYMIQVSLDGFIEKKFSVERQSSHSIESLDIVYSSYVNEREIFLVRRNLNTSFFEFQKIKVGVEPYYAAYDYSTFPTILKNKVEKRRGADFLFVNQRGEFVCLALKRDNHVSFRSNGNLIQEKRLELKDQINMLTCGQKVPYMAIHTDKGVHVWMIEWNIS